MSDWTLAPTLRVLLAEINTRWPIRDKTSDGTLGNAAHQAGSSDHNPDARGVVCAIDVDEDLTIPRDDYPSFHVGQGARELKDELIANAKAGLTPQLYYVIYERKIYSRTYHWREQIYQGPSPHDHHLHVSVYHPAKYADTTKPWGIEDMALSVADKTWLRRRFAKRLSACGIRCDPERVGDDAGKNPTVRAKSALVEIGNDANAIRAAVEKP